MILLSNTEPDGTVLDQAALPTAVTVRQSSFVPGGDVSVCDDRRIFDGDPPPRVERHDAFTPTRERIEQEISIVMQLELSTELREWVDAYGCVGHRSPYLWNWCRRGVEVTMLPCVAGDLRGHVCDTKVLGVMLDVLLDDVADMQGGDSGLLEYLLGMPYGRRTAAPKLTAAQQAYADLTAAVWKAIESRTGRFPHFADYAALLKFDYLQLFNAMRYSHLLNADLSLLNLTEHDLYLPHNMHMIVSSTMDLMCSPDFDRAELGRLRDAMWRVQSMGRIGNLVTTWQREIGERDFSSGVFAHAVYCGTVTAADLLSQDQGRMQQAIQNGGHEDFFLRRWQAYRRELIAMQPKVRSVDLGSLIRGLERLLCLHLGSRGYK